MLNARRAGRDGAPRRLVIGLLSGLITAGALAGCVPRSVPSEPFQPIAVRLSGDAVEVLYTDCRPVKVERAWIVRPDPKDTVIKETDPVVWERTFNPLSTETRFVAVPLDPDTEYAAFLRLDNDIEPHASFRPSALADGRVSFQGGYLSREEFARRSSCSSPSG